MVDKGTCLRFYKRKDIQNAIIAAAGNREIGIRYGDGFGKRPDILIYPREVLELALQGATSFHCSEERWSNPISLSSEGNRKDQDELRTGWDLLLDIDCAFLEYSKIAAHTIITFLSYCGVREISCKFSGGKGFHIGIPFEAFPRKVGNMLTKDLFPEAPRKIALYIKESIKGELGKRILEFEKGDFSAIREKVALPAEEIVRTERTPLGETRKLDVDRFLEIDTILLASRHLYRMPYSLHEKEGLVSVPIDPWKVLAFEKPMARPERVSAPMLTFLDRQSMGESARKLLLQALDFRIRERDDGENPRHFEEVSVESPITENFFPPCMQSILKGMDDGKKRGVFCLMNFLGKTGWSKNDIEKLLHEWNAKNRQPLREVYIKGQLNHFTPGGRLPPNCNNDAYYPSMGVACKAEHCRKFKNPVNYTLWKWRRAFHERAEKGRDG